MTDYVLEGPKWGNGGLGSAGGTITWSPDASVPSGFAGIIGAAFSDWAHYANIQFQEVASTASAAITLRFGAIDGLDNILGQTDYNTSGSELTSAAIEFDTGEQWHFAGSAAVSADNVNFFDVALHEIGHALGMDHYNAGPAVMNATLNRSVTDLTSSDVDGIQALYGPNPDPYVTVTHDLSSAAGQVYALYDAILDRTPDTLGFETYVAQMQGGTSLHDVAAEIIGSAEAQTHVGAADNGTFVQQMYQTALGRGADPGGLSFYTGLLNNGASRADIAIDFALSDENQSQMQGALTAGVDAPDPTASDVARLYFGVLGRAPDADGLSHYAESVNQGTSLTDLAQWMLNSAEYQGAHGGSSDTQFVESLYANALGRTADAGGLQTYLGDLANGTSRAAVAFFVAESGEAHNHLLSVIENSGSVA